MTSLKVREWVISFTESWPDWAERTRDRGCRLHWFGFSSSSWSELILNIGTHVIYELQKTRKYKVISLDNHHNSFPAALTRVSALSQSELPANATETDKKSTEIEAHKCDLTKPDEIRAVFAKYGKGGIWGVIHIAVSPYSYFRWRYSNRRHVPGLQGSRRINWDSPHLLCQQCWCYRFLAPNYGRIRMQTDRVLVIGNCLWNPPCRANSRVNTTSSRQPIRQDQGHERNHHWRSLPLYVLYNAR